MYERAGLGYGLFHANAQPNKLYGLVTTGVSFKGVMMDIGHVRHNRWVKDTGVPVTIYGVPLPQNPSDPGSRPITDGAAYAKQRWVAYNRMRGQYASALEHTIPERLLTDTSKCNALGSPNVNPNQPACPIGVSASRLLGLATEQGQKVFTIRQSNAGIAIPQLQHRSSVIDEVWNSVNAGKEVTIHQSAVSTDSWSGAGYAVIAPETGAGGYLIEGGARGGFIKFLDDNAGLISLGAALLGAVTAPLSLAWFLALTIALAVVAAGLIVYLDTLDGKCKGNVELYAAVEVVALSFGIKATGFVGVFIAWFIGFFGDGAIRGTTEGRC